MRQRMGRRSTGRRKLAPRAILRLALLLAALVLLFVAGVKLVTYIAQGQRTRETQALLQKEVAEAQTQASPAPSLAPPEPSPEINLPAQAQISQPPQAPLPTQGAPIMNHLLSQYSRNKDLAGWLKSDLIAEIDFPILHRDNHFYVNHDFNGRENLAGWVFLDESNSILPQDQNLVLHGHNMKNGTMFGKLTRFLSAQSMASAPLFTFSTLYHTQVYVPYAVSLTSIDPAQPHYFNFLQPNFSDSAGLMAYSDWLRQHSRLILPVDVREGDRLLTLVTCHGDESSERLVLALCALRPEETREEVLSHFTLPSSSN